MASENNKISFIILLALSFSGFLVGYLLLGNYRNVSNDRSALIGFEPVTEKYETPQNSRLNKISPISHRRALSPFMVPNSDSVMFFDEATGQLLELNMENKDERAVPGRSYSNLIKALWAPDGTSFIAVIASGNDSKYLYVPLSGEDPVLIGINLMSPRFSSDSRKIAYGSDKDGLVSVSVFNSQDQTVKSIWKTRLKNVSLYWTGDNKIIVKADHGSSSEFYKILPDEGIEKIFEIAGESDNVFSPDSNHMVFSKINKQGLDDLWLFNVQTQSENILTKGAGKNKCAWANNDDLVCSRPSGDGNGSNDVYVLNKSSGKENVIFRSSQYSTGVIVDTIIAGGKYAIFKNSFDDRLYALTL